MGKPTEHHHYLENFIEQTEPVQELMTAKTPYIHYEKLTEPVQGFNFEVEGSLYSIGGTQNTAAYGSPY